MARPLKKLDGISTEKSTVALLIIPLSVQSVRALILPTRNAGEQRHQAPGTKR